MGCYDLRLSLAMLFLVLLSQHTQPASDFSFYLPRERERDVRIMQDESAALVGFALRRPVALLKLL